MRTLVIVILVAAAGFLYTYFQQASRDAGGNIVSEGNIDAFSIQVGDCFNDDPGLDATAEVFGVAGIPCTQPHDNEVYAIFNTSLTEFPGNDRMGEVASDECVARFEAFVGRDYMSSQLDVLPMYPTQESWEQMGDREIVCALYDLDLVKLEGSMRQSGL